MIFPNILSEDLTSDWLGPTPSTKLAVIWITF